MPRPSGYPYANLRLGGRLAERLTEWRTEGLSFDSIAFRLREHGVVVTGETVRQWVREHGLEPTEAKENCG